MAVRAQIGDSAPWWVNADESRRELHRLPHQ